MNNTNSINQSLLSLKTLKLEIQNKLNLSQGIYDILYYQKELKRINTEIEKNKIEI